MSHPEPKIIAGLAYPGMQLLDLTGPLEAFNLAAQQLIDDGLLSTRAYRVEIISKSLGPVTSMSGVSVQATRTLADGADGIDTLLIPGALTFDLENKGEDPELASWLASVSTRVRRLGSICSGAFLLAASGVLDNRCATTHWMDSSLLQQRYPKVKVDSDRIYQQDGSIFTSAGITAGIDLALAMIESDFTRDLALKVARRMVVFLKRPGDQSQFSEFLVAQTQSSKFGELIDWMMQNLDRDIRTADLAELMHMSTRNFCRAFEREFDITPAKYLARARLEKARSLLEGGDNRLVEVARRCGFGSVDRLRRAFRFYLGITPSQYLERFGH